ncbi:hypothetical protein P8452_17307 [Trifolium repens]|nr:hypothetical protein P8452_17307 [Trifolium repens]
MILPHRGFRVGIRLFSSHKQPLTQFIFHHQGTNCERCYLDFKCPFYFNHELHNYSKSGKYKGWHSK